MNIKDLKTKEVKELYSILAELRLKLESFGTEVLQGKEKNVKKGRFIKKDIARVLTLIKIKESENLNA